ncbi:hypothetical protein QLQ12_43905 [Actinoplanes sp. NEAU-A12]|uniref:Lipoprotein n=1 Tax=Actinoplanes sandaracinus TaxID=3045177 RepID=A0ABT6X0N7_9ACTN|nr:hypothetical protein [Actinoplanes sandaracinus]MDI6105549.1 hypothetical protein [Actinoplanes sandaracinus]
MRNHTALTIVALALLAGALAACSPAGRATRPPGPPGGSACALPADANAPNSEWAACARVAAALSQPPARGETVTLSVEVTVAVDAAARIEIDLPGGFAWAGAPAGLTLTDHPVPNPADGGCLHRAAGTITLGAGQSVRLTGTVTAVATGFATLRARAVLPGGGDGASSVFVTVGETPEDSTLGYRPGTGHARAVPPSAGPSAGC